MKTLYETYRDFLQHFSTASAKQQQAMTIPRAQLSGAGLGFFSLDREVASRLVCRTIEGQPFKENAHGTHAVCRQEGVFYKPNSFGANYIQPEREFAIYALYQLLGRKGTAPAMALKVQHLFFDGQEQNYGRVLQAGYGVDGLLLEELLRMSYLPSFLECCLGAKRAQELFVELVEQDWERTFLENHPHLSKEQLDPLPLEEKADRLIQEFEKLFTPLPSHQRLHEFIDLPADQKARWDFCAHIHRNGSTRWLVAILSLLNRYPNQLTMITLKKTEPRKRQVSFTELTDLCLYLEKSRKQFPQLSAVKLWEELSSLPTKFDPADFSTHFIASLLSDPSDHKADNLMVTLKKDAQGRVQHLSLVGIDNDLAFSPSEEMVRSMVYLLPAMDSPLNAEVKQRLCELGPEELVLNWLIALEQQNHSYERWKKQKILQPQDLFEEGEPSLSLPLQLDSTVIPTLYHKAQKLIHHLQRHPEATHWELFETIQERLAKAYQSALSRQDRLEDAYAQVSNCFQGVGSSPPSSPSTHTPREAARLFVQALGLAQLSLKQQVSLIGKTLDTFPMTLDALPLPGNPADPASRQEFFLLAVRQGHCALVARLLEEERRSRLFSEEQIQTSLLETKTPEEQTPLLIACFRLDLEMIRLLLSYGADPQTVDSSQQSAPSLCMASFAKTPAKTGAALRLLGQHQNIPWNKICGFRCTTPLHDLIDQAASAPEEAEPLIAYLMAKGAIADLVDKRGKTALDYAMEQQLERPTEQLIRLGAGRTLNIEIAQTFFSTRPHLKETYLLLQSQSLLLRWHLAMDQLRSLPGNSGYQLQSAQFGPIDLPQSITSALFDKKGDITALIPYGRRNVNRITLPTGEQLYVKQYPEMPGMEYAISQLFTLLIGHGTSFTELARVTTKGKNYPVLLSQGIQGDNLHDVLSDPVKSKQLHHLDPLAFSELFIASLLVNFEDAKPDNFILEPLPTGSYRLVGIDNDHAFVPPLLKEGEKTVQVKCIFYCLDQAKQPLHPQAKERFLAFSPQRLLHVWLERLSIQQERYYTLFPSQERKKLFNKGQNGGVVVPIPLKEGTIIDLYQKIQCLQTALREKEQITGLELLRLVIPSLGILYEEAFDKSPHPLQRFYALTGSQYQMHEGRGTTIVNSRHMLKSLKIPEKALWEAKAEQGPLQALAELERIRQEQDMSLHNRSQIRNALQKGETNPFEQLLLDTEKEKILNGIPGAFEGIRFQAMPYQTQQKVLSTILKGNYRKVRLFGCDALDEAALNTLLRRSPQLLVLELNRCSQVDQSMLKRLAQADSLNQLRLLDLPQLKGEIHLPHPSLRHLQLVNCHGIDQLLISDTLKSLEIKQCFNLKSIEAKHYSYNRLRGHRLGKETTNFSLEKLHLAATPQLQPWWTLFDQWLKASPTHDIRLEKISPNPTQEQQKLLRILANYLASGNQEFDTSITYSDLLFLTSTCPGLSAAIRLEVRKRVFGEEKWKRYFGDVGAEPPLPPNIFDILSGPCPIWPDKILGETHKLVLVPATVNGTPLTLDLLEQLIQSPRQGHATKYSYYYDEVKKKHGSSSLPSHWILMTKDVLP